MKTRFALKHPGAVGEMGGTGEEQMQQDWPKVAAEASRWVHGGSLHYCLYFVYV